MQAGALAQEGSVHRRTGRHVPWWIPTAHVGLTSKVRVSHELLVCELATG